MTAITHEECFRPLTGISLFLLTLTEEEVRSALFSSPHGDFSFSIFLACHHQHNGANRFRPLTGISLFLSHLLSMSWRKLGKFSSPHGDFSFSIAERYEEHLQQICFRPLTGISLFLWSCLHTQRARQQEFSSPHGDFSFSIASRPDWRSATWTVFVPSRGFLFFYRCANSPAASPAKPFSSPHGDFSFSILSHIPLINQGLFL